MSGEFNENKRTANVESEYKITPKEQNNTIVIQKRKPSILASILLILIGALIATIILLSLYIIKENRKVEVYEEPNTEIKDNNNEKEKEKVNLDLSIEGEFVKELYKKIPLQVRGYEPYSGNKVFANSISDNNKLLFTIRTLQSEYKYEVITDINSIKSKLHNKTEYIPETSNAMKFDFEEAKTRYKSIFGSNKEIPLIDAETTLGYVYEYVPQDNCYYGHSYSGGGGGDYQDSRKIYKVQQNENATEVNIYDYYISYNSLSSGYTMVGHGLFSISGDNFGDFEISEDNFKNGLIKQVESANWENYQPVIEGKTISQLLEEYIGNGAGEYKHTYKLDNDGNYYWYSSEKIN